MTFLDYPDWREGRDEWATEHLLDQDDVAALRAESEHGRLTPDEMVSWWGLERADAMGLYDARDYGWWEKMTPIDELGMRLCRILGIPPDNVSAVVITHQVGDLAYVTLTCPLDVAKLMMLLGGGDDER